MRVFATASSSPVEDLKALSTEELLARLRGVEAELEDVAELSRGILGGTGIHVGARLAKRARHLYEDKGAELRAQIEQLRKVLEERGVNL